MTACGIYGAPREEAEVPSKRVTQVRDLTCWQRAVDLVVECYRLAQRMPSMERFALCDQLRRAAVSVPANIAEGYGRRPGQRDFARFLQIAHGSLMEVETYVVIAERLHYFTPEELAPARDLATHVGRLVNGLRRSVLADVSVSPTPHQSLATAPRRAVPVAPDD
jgi:four helix bundle protein